MNRGDAILVAAVAGYIIAFIAVTWWAWVQGPIPVGI
jgi:hypothetical protein